ncbi:N-acetylmuramoyl-L-alanine amidase [Rufibacter sp. DG15C]|uniref:N-acetylmuramoyl-L-alanine amidase n=1 Tax=Rufibacter sp. DG15C TaxID=1379909 RepID=UPI00078C3FC2|nr:N-acetylmuramoyl-L-alanine amidase [Rufibacter sp. DG15C]AMM51460.1 N-acetylmuramoyl-L-alanine amidase [Rufibacter sp. DG15C]
MKLPLHRLLLCCLLVLTASACTKHPYADANKSYKKQVKALAKSLRTTPVTNPGEDSLKQGDYWVGTTNFNLRKPNYVVIHHTAQDSTAQTLKTFTLPRTQVSAHYVIGRDGKVYHMLNDYLRAWHGGSGRWGNNTDINSSSIGIELDNNGTEPFQEAQLESLQQVLAILKKTHKIPTENFIGHSDIAPTRKNDPSRIFPWKRLSEAGFGLWYDEAEVEKLILEETLDRDTLAQDSSLALVLITPQKPDVLPTTVPTLIDSTYLVPTSFNPKDALKIIGYDTKDLPAAIRAFKLHFIQADVSAVLTDRDKKVLYYLYRKYLDL